jgi:hypothetical protein
MDKSLAKRTSVGGRKAGVLLVGGLIGALTGVGAAYLLWQAREKRLRGTDADEPLMSSGRAVKLGVMLFGLLRQINEVAQGK